MRSWFVGHVVELEPHHHLRGQQVRAARAGLDAEGLRERRDGLVGLPRLDVGDAQHLRQLDVGRRPRTRVLEQGDGFGEATGQVVRETEHLHGLATLERVAREGRTISGASSSMACG